MPRGRGRTPLWNSRLEATLLRNSDLALNGGPPVRSVPFVPSCAIGGDEIARVTECIESHQWSSFLGSCAGFDLREVCTMPSVAAAEYDALELRFLGGKFVRDVEAEFARRWEVPYAVSSNSATSCLVMALAAVNVGPGDEVLVPAMSFNATATSILGVNGIPVFCEVKDDTFCIDPEDMERRITPRTRAILVVHLGGTNADRDVIMSITKHDIPVIEDCAQALGVAYNGRQNGTIGDIGVFSFTETKQITCGEGGMLITSNPTYAMKARLVRNHGEGVVGEDWPEEDLVNVVGEF